MVDKLKTILEEMKSANKPVWLFAILKMDELVNKWSVVMSAPWITTEKERVNEFNYVLGLIKSHLNDQELASIARLALLPREDHLVRELLRKQPDEKIEGQINGNLVHEGLVIESNPELQWS